MQSKLDSLIESILNVGIGFGVSVLANFVIFPWVGLSASTGQILWIGAGITLVSVARSYLVRRFCNSHLTKIRKKIYEKIVSYTKRDI